MTFLHKGTEMRSAFPAFGVELGEETWAIPYAGVKDPGWGMSRSESPPAGVTKATLISATSDYRRSRPERGASFLFFRTVSVEAAMDTGRLVKGRRIETVPGSPETRPTNSVPDGATVERVRFANATPEIEP